MNVQTKRMNDGQTYISVVITTCLIRKDVRNREQRAWRKSSLNLFFNLISKSLDGFSCQVLFLHLVECLLKIRYCNHASQCKHIVWMGGFNFISNQIPRLIMCIGKNICIGKKERQFSDKKYIDLIHNNLQ